MIKILTYPDPFLRRISGAVEEGDDSIKQLIEDMADAMYNDDGVGLAAPQIGVSKRVIVLDAGEGFRALINPEILSTSAEKDRLEEGCLSVPGVRVDVNRPVEITLKALDEKGEELIFKASGLHARVIQHEIDHLNGILIIDHAGSVQSAMIRSKLKKLEKSA